MALIAMRINDDLNIRLEKVSEKMERSKSFIIRKSIESYLEEIEEAQEALQILNDPTTEWIDYDENLRKELGINKNQR